MAEEPENAVLRMLREMRARLDQLEDMRAALERVEIRVNELYEVATYGLGLAASGHLRADGLAGEIKDLNARVGRLEADQ